MKKLRRSGELPGAGHQERSLMSSTQCSGRTVGREMEERTTRLVSRGMRVTCWTCGGSGMRDEAYPKVVDCERCGGKGARLLINHCRDHAFADRWVA
jgi:DnaJ-class molecular chaperone